MNSSTVEHFTLYSCNRNVTLKMVGLPAEMCVGEVIATKIHRWN